MYSACQNLNLRFGIDVGDLIEVFDNGQWQSVEVVSISIPGEEVLIHYQGNYLKWDKKIKLNSSNVRTVDC